MGNRIEKKHLMLLVSFFVTCLFLLPMQGYGLVVEGDFEFDPSTGTITDYLGSDENVVVPELINGVRVVAIGRNSFSATESIETISLPDTITEINFAAFSSCNNLRSINIPSGVKVIDRYTFYACSSLELVSISGELESIEDKAFYNCIKLSNIDLSEGIKVIGERAFFRCSSLNEILLPSTVSEIGESAFAYCTGLETMIIPDGIEEIKSGTFKYCASIKSIDLPKSIKQIGSSAFMNCESLISFQIPELVSEISDETFRGCKSLKSIYFHKGITKIGSSAFSECKALTELLIPQNIVILGAGAFERCTSLVDVVILAELEELDDNCFRSCISLKNVTLPNEITRIGAYTFYNCSSLENIRLPESLITIDYSGFRNCTLLKEISVPASLKKLGSIAFGSCISLEKIELPIQMTSIDSNAFSSCTSLVSITMPKKINELGKRVFYSCENLVSIEVPEGITKLEDEMFLNCYRLTEVQLPDSLLIIGEGAFSSCIQLKYISLPPNVEEIERSSFNWCRNLEKIEFSDKLRIVREPFYRCDSLESVEFPSSLETFYSNPFSHCSSLRSSYFYGDAPKFYSSYSLFIGSDDDFKITYLNGAVGWSNPWNGYETQVDSDANTVLHTSSTNCSSENASDGTITVKSFGGSGIYDFRINESDWFNEEDAQNTTGTFQIRLTDTTTSTFQVQLSERTTGTFQLNVSELEEGDYYLQARDRYDISNKTNEILIKIIDTFKDVAISITKEAVSVFGGSDGSIKIDATGGSLSYEYSINSGDWQNSDTFSDLSAGTYEVQARDINNISNTSDSISVIIMEPNETVSFESSITNVSKYNGSDGSITIQAQGGSGIYQYSIDNGATWSISHVFENLKASSYYVLVRDKDDISNITNAVLLTITQPADSSNDDDNDDNDDDKKKSSSNSSDDNNSTSSSDNTVDGDKVLESVKIDERDIKIPLSDGTPKVAFDPLTIRSYFENNDTLVISSGQVQLKFDSDSLLTGNVNESTSNSKASLEIGARVISNLEKSTILKKIPKSQLEAANEVGDKIFDFTARVVTLSDNGKTQSNDIGVFGKLVAVSIDLSDVNLTENEIKQLTAVRFVENEDGTVKRVMLGGDYNPSTKQFTFYTEHFSLYSVAVAEELKKIDLVIGSKTTKINGLEKVNDTAPVIINNRTMVPLRFIAENLDAKVEWEAETRTVTVNQDGKRLKLVIDQLVEGTDAKAIIINDRTFVPVRYISESFGCQVQWLGDNQIVKIVQCK